MDDAYNTVNKYIYVKKTQYFTFVSVLTNVYDVTIKAEPFL